MIRTMIGMSHVLARVGDVLIPSNASAGDAKTFITISLKDIVGADGACSSIETSGLVDCEPVHVKLKEKNVFSNGKGGGE
jgi:hypothetical protein